jgi:D-amino peptidase
VKVYIAVDSEGSACVVREKGPDGVYGTWQAEYVRVRATREAAAAVEGARAGGADDIVVHDVGFVRGLAPCGLVLHYDQLPRGIRIALGVAPMKDVADASFDAAMLIGIHAMAGVADGVLAHTFSSVGIENMWLNGKRIGEIGIQSLVLGGFGIPVVMVSADEAGCREAVEWLGDVETAPTKRGLNAHGAVSLHPEDACDLIRAKAQAALARLADFKPLTLDPPYELRTDCYTAEYAQRRAARKNGVMDGPKSFVVTLQDACDLIV